MWRKGNPNALLVGMQTGVATVEYSTTFPQKTTIKDTWIKPRGRVEAGEGGGFGWGAVERWGENADNCN